MQVGEQAVIRDGLAQPHHGFLAAQKPGEEAEIDTTLRAEIIIWCAAADGRGSCRLEVALEPDQLADPVRLRCPGEGQHHNSSKSKAQRLQKGIPRKDRSRLDDECPPSRVDALVPLSVYPQVCGLNRAMTAISPKMRRIIRRLRHPTASHTQAIKKAPVCSADRGQRDQRRGTGGPSPALRTDGSTVGGSDGASGGVAHVW